MTADSFGYGRSKYLLLFMAFAGILAAVTYFSTVTTSVFPGYSASLVAESAGELPAARAAHPLFSLVARHVAGINIFSLPVRLNLMSAFCGVFCAILLCLLARRILFFSLSEDAGGGGRINLNPEKAVSADDDFFIPPEVYMPPEVAAYNIKVLDLASIGGFLASIIFILSVPVWSAATRLDNGLFTVLLVLVSFTAFPDGGDRFHSAKLGISLFFYVLGLAESGALIITLPIYAYLMFRAYFFASKRKKSAAALMLLSGISGVICVLGAFHLNTGRMSVLPALNFLYVFAKEMWAHHFSEISSFFPGHGWILIILQVALPAGVILFGCNTLLRRKKTGTLVALLLLTLSVIPSLLNLSFAPLGIYFKLTGRLPVISSLVIAVATAFALTVCLIFTLLPNNSEEMDRDENSKSSVLETRTFPGFRKISAILLAVLVLICIISLHRSWSAMDTRQGDFADRVAKEMLISMKGRTCLVTNGLLNNHLSVQAQVLGKPVTIITLRARPVPYETESLKQLIGSSSLFEGLNRIRLQNALSISPIRFVLEWLETDEHADEKVMLFATPDLWTACGYQAVPEGMAFSGLKTGGNTDLALLEKENRSFVEHVSPLLSRKSSKASTGVAWLQRMLQMKAAFASNELGVLLEEHDKPEAAYASYERAVLLDSYNVSAAVNSYVLISEKGFIPEAEDKLKKRMKKRVENAHIKSSQNINWILQNHGTIRQQKFYRQQMEAWSSMGSRAVAAEKFRKANSLIESTENSSLLQNAAFYLQAGNESQAENCYLAVLDNDSGNNEALLGLCTLKIGQKKLNDAEKWYQKAVDVGIKPGKLRYQTVMLAILKKDGDQTLKLLKTATKEVPKDSRYWVLLADFLLNRGDIQYVEHQLLPDMQKSLDRKENYMVDAVRGMALQMEGPSSFKKARLSFLKALSQNAALPEIWTNLLQLDMRLGVDEFTETDARDLLKIEPDHPLANYLVGGLLLKRGKLTEAEDFFRRSIEIKPASAVFNDLAEDLRLQSKLAEAETFARQSLKLTPDLLPALDTLANILADMEKYDEAVKTVERAVAIKPDFKSAQLTLLRIRVCQADKKYVRDQISVLAGLNIAIPETLIEKINALK